MSSTLRTREHVPLKDLTTFKIGGEARFFAEVRTESELCEAIKWARENGVEFVVLGGGSNVLVSDAGFDGLIIHIRCADFSFAGNVLTANAGCNLLALIRAAAEKGCGGWENMAGIPGTIGGAVRGNAGAFGSEIKDFVQRVSALNTQTLERQDFQNTECDFSYRHSFFKDHWEWIITSAQVRLVHTDLAESKRLIEETIAEREKRHLQNVRAAGSFFMNPVAPAVVIAQFEQEKQVKSRENRVPAGWLIEKAGMKGAVVGGAQASMQHPNYIVNMSDAKAVDVRALAEKIKAAVRERFGIELQEEAAML